MKKLFTLFATALVASSAMATEPVVIDFSANPLNLEAYKQEEPITITSNGVTVVFNKANATVDPRLDLDQMRVYKNSTFTITSTVGNMKVITFEESSSNYSVSNLTTTVGTYTSPTWTGDAAELTFTAANQARLKKITVSFDAASGDDGGNTGGGDDNDPSLPTLNDVNTISNLIACYDNGVAKDNDIVKVEGYISNMFLKPTSFTRYGSVCIWLAENEGSEAKEFELYNCYGINADTLATYVPADGSEIDPTISTNINVTCVTDRNGVTYTVGAKVVAEGKMKKYNTTYELNTGCYIVSINNSTAIEGIKSEAIKSGKIMKGGKLYIISNGSTYDASGVLVK